jgi:putative ABC transport system permease protein
VGMGLIVGIVVVYQILYTSITQCLPEYATLKAMGYKDGFFFGLIVRQAFLLALLAYVPGILVAHLLYLITRHSTLLPIFMTAQRALFVFGLTVFMCCFSGFIATRKLRDADPAEIF